MDKSHRMKVFHMPIDLQGGSPQDLSHEGSPVKYVPYRPVDLQEGIPQDLSHEGNPNERALQVCRPARRHPPLSLS